MKVAVLLGLAFAAVACGLPVVDELPNFLEFDENSFVNPREAWITKVPCGFCNSSIEILLELCRGSKGNSVDHVEDFLVKCTQIGGLTPTQWDRMAVECSETVIDQQRVNFIYERRLRCAKIFRALVRTYDPYDPCNQIRNDFQRNPMAVCKSGEIDCVMPNAPPKNESKMQPPYETNTSFPFQTPPLNCIDYAHAIVEECKLVKESDFHTRSNLDGWCGTHYNGTYEQLGCQTVVNKLVTRDSYMDLCSGLKIFPADKDITWMCLHPRLGGVHVTVPEYNLYLKHLEGYHKLEAYKEMLVHTKTLSRGEVVLIP
eukprot:c32318_g1_i1.p1 GENE.c32318_g1_i1~~c32318_g1_i1.p1  ORF type:complete len:326 (-),score=64.74 c32318_g1_i1:37-981(-)